MTTAMIDATPTHIDETLVPSVQVSSRAGLQAVENDVLHIVIRERYLPAGLSQIQSAMNKMSVIGGSTTSRVLKDYLLSVEPFVIKAK
jgi:hypothetical protein